MALNRPARANYSVYSVAEERMMLKLAVLIRIAQCIGA